MKQYFFALFIFLIAACSDGDLQIAPIDFNSSTIADCPLVAGQDDIERRLFFRIEENETLILNLQAGLLADATATDIIFSSIGSQSTLAYRLFSDNVTNAYFCSDIPPLAPTVLEEIIAQSGTLSLMSVIDTVTTTTKSYQHTIDITNLVIENSIGERIIDQTELNFGTFETLADNSFQLDFVNYDAINVTECDTVSGLIRLFKTNNDELITLDLPSALFANEATTEARTADLASEAIFSNNYFSGIVSSELVCGDMFQSIELLNQFTAISGTASVTTVENEASTAESPLFTHTIVLTNFSMNDVDGNELGEIEIFTFGTIITSTN